MFIDLYTWSLTSLDRAFARGARSRSIFWWTPAAGRLGDVPEIQMYGTQPECYYNPPNGYMQRLHLKCVSTSAQWSAGWERQRNNKCSLMYLILEIFKIKYLFMLFWVLRHFWETYFTAIIILPFSLVMLMVQKLHTSALKVHYF